ncbi:MAG: twin-arginine translocase subunit TatC, partial [Candidatus Saccharimonadales bacterium]
MKQKRKQLTRTNNPRSERATTSSSQTFMDHVRELQGRLSIVALSFLVVAGSAYPFFDRIAAMLTAPLGGHQQLVYLTPGGAFGFIIQ